MHDRTRKLSTRQERFVVEVIAGKAAGPAYLAAYGCSKATAETRGPALLRSAQVAAEVSRRQSVVAAAVERREIITRAEILTQLRKIGLASTQRDEDHPTYADQVRALAVAADLLGLRVEEAPHPDRPINDMTSAQRRARIAELRAREQA